jgi:hypothetical protein
MTHFGGLLSFAFGGTILAYLIAYLINDFSHANTPPLAIGIFIGFLFVGYGLFANMKSTKPT